MKRQRSVDKQRGQSEFKRYDNRRFAVILDGLPSGGHLRGTARFERDDQLGNILRIDLDGDIPGKPAICVSEDDFGGLIVQDDRYGCEFSLVLMNDIDSSARQPQSSKARHRRAATRQRIRFSGLN